MNLINPLKIPKMITNLCWYNGVIQSESVNKKWNFTIEPTKKQIDEYRKAHRKMLLNKIIGKLKMQVAKQISHRIAL